VIRRAAAAIFILWALGFLWFVIALPKPAGDGIKTDAVIVPTGGAGRIDRGIALLREDRARALLVTGVDPEVKPGEFAAQFDVPMELMDCCVTLGFSAVDTRSNAMETAEWVSERKVGSLVLVTTDWHMRRAASELARELPDDVEVTQDAVPSEPSLRILFLEYHKLLASAAARLING